MLQDAPKTILDRPKKPPRRLKRPPRPSKIDFDFMFALKAGAERQNPSRKLLVLFSFPRVPRRNNDTDAPNGMIIWKMKTGITKNITPTGVQDAQ